MTIKASGASLSFTEIIAEFTGGSNPRSLSQYYKGGARVPSGTTGVPASGAINFASFYSKSNSVPGNQTYSTPGTYTFTVPASGWSTLTVTVDGAGGSGGHDQVGGSNAGGNSSFNSSVIGGGANGGSNAFYTSGPIPGGAGGTASGGDTNTSGNVGGTAPYGGGPGAGGTSAAGASGGSGAQGGVAGNGAAPGGGGGGSNPSLNCASGGGGGGRAVKTYNTSTLTPGASITVVVGAGGASRAPGVNQSGAGGDGKVYIAWS